MLKNILRKIYRLENFRENVFTYGVTRVMWNRVTEEVTSCHSRDLRVWLAEWCKIHKVYIYSHSTLKLSFTNIFIHIQQLN